MTNPQAHVERVYMCFLPFQYTQVRQTGIDWLDERVVDYYHQQEDTLDDLTGNNRLIGIPAGNPKRYTSEDELLLHERLSYYLIEQPLTIDLTTLHSYIDVSGLYWTIKDKWPECEVIGYSETIPSTVLTETKLPEHQMYQLLPLTYKTHNISASEWSASETADNVLIVLDPELLPSSLLAAGSATVVLMIYFKDSETDDARIARNGQLVHFSSLREAIIYDALHYGRQYKVEPVVLGLARGESSVMTQYGNERPSSTAIRYRMQNPHYPLFPSKYRDLKNLSLNHFADSYGSTFTITEFSQLLPLKYQVELIQEMLMVDNP
ncbi:hypothetical protein [Macrococcus carouselicus]|uniref:Uncharacterized protein n=1 Tax=Macrococcus carouselicus TaxID=69969 RepID=A0A9Q8CLC1_9STAP|nr:hypothetical protein [Macrococcus carouselicus]TDM03748.1 hypothetical protein ERX40_00875 [Macrococcus carouselicus]